MSNIRVEGIAIANNILNVLKVNAVNVKDYLSGLTQKIKNMNPLVVKVAAVSTETIPMAGTPSQENIIATQPSLKPLDKIKAIIIDEKNDSLTARVMRAVASVQSLEETQLEWQDAFNEGGTGYIDGVKPSDLSKPIMWGIDSWDRPFVALKLREANGVGEPGVETLFQRYIDVESVWASGKHYLRLPQCVEIINSRMGSEEVIVFNKLIRGETVALQGSFGDEVSVKVAD